MRWNRTATLTIAFLSINVVLMSTKLSWAESIRERLKRAQKQEADAKAFAQAQTLAAQPPQNPVPGIPPSPAGKQEERNFTDAEKAVIYEYLNCLNEFNAASNSDEMDAATAKCSAKEVVERMEKTRAMTPELDKKKLFQETKTFSPDIAKMIIKDVKITGDTAQVFYMLNGAPGSGRLTEEKGKWKLN